MARIMASNTDSGIESDPEAEQSVLLVVDIGDSVITSRDDIDDTDCRSVVDEMSSSLTSADSSLTTVDDIIDDTKTTTSSFKLTLASGEVLTVSLDQFCEYETKCLPEFFDSSAKGKSPKSYLEIRNHFLNHWNSFEPKRRFGYHEMLRKVSHLHLGNVTAFSRVQKFLESHKAINNCSKVKNRRLCRQNGVKREKRETNRRQVTTTTTEETTEAQAKRTRPNPFKLVPLETYDQSATEAPFVVRLSMEALAVIDIHAHCVRTEVIGLLGGRYCPRTRELKIMTSEPCSSLDDHDLQCDMEPVSQALAKDALERKSYDCVGWYHSHPTFVPNPSLRDLETQLMFQRMFRNDSNRPFIALILSPYCHSPPLEGVQTGSKQQLVSRFKCLWLSDQNSLLNDYKIPFELKPKIIRTDKLFVSLEQKLEKLFQSLKSHSSRVRMCDKVKRFRFHNQEITHLEKLALSLNHFLRETGLSYKETKHVLNMCRDCIERHLLESKETNISLDLFKDL